MKSHSDLTCSWNNKLKFCFTADEVECIFKSYKKIFGKEMESLNDLKEVHHLLYNPRFTAILKKECSRLYEAIRYQSLRPGFETNENGWLNEQNISDVVKQYETQNRLLFLGTMAIDEIPSIWPQRRFSAIVNLSKRSEGGSHWVAVYRNGGYSPIEYFDPAGDKPAFRLGFNAQVNKKKHQKDDSNCGVYCLYYILARSSGTPLQFFESKDITTDDMEEFFETLFVTYSE